MLAQASVYDSVASFEAAYGDIGLVAKSSCLGSTGLLPYTLLLLATMVCRLPWRRAASSTMAVPVALDRWLAIGSATLRGTLPSAARCTMAAAPAHASSRAASSRMLPSMKRTGSPAMLAALPVTRLSSTTTSSTPGVASSRRHRLAPIKPAPPVTTTRMGRKATRAAKPLTSMTTSMGGRRW